jgi:hypothetical protein
LLSGSAAIERLADGDMDDAGAEGTIESIKRDGDDASADEFIADVELARFAAGDVFEQRGVHWALERDTAKDETLLG